MTNPIIQEIPESPNRETQQFRSQVGHISRQSGIFFAGTLFTTGLGYLFKVYLAHTLGANDLGLYALGMTMIGFVGVFNALGLPQSAIRFVATYLAAGKYKELHALLWSGGAWLVLVNVLLAGLLLTFGRAVAVRFYHSVALVRYLPFFAVLMLLGIVSSFCGKVLAGYRDIKLRTWIVNFIGSPATMLGSVLFIAMGMGLGGYLMAQVLTTGLVCLLLLGAVRKLTPRPARLLSQKMSNPEKEVWSFSAAMLGIVFLEFLVTQVDKIALGFYRGASAVGVYSVAAAFVAYVPLILSSINQIFAPTIADLHARRESALLGRLFQSLTKWAIALTLPLAIVVIVFARPLMGIFGSDFEGGWPILIIGTIGQLVNCGVGSVGYLLLMSGHEKRLIKVQVVMALVMVAGSFALVPPLGIIGAAVAAAVTNIGMNVWNLIEVRRALGLSPYNRGYLQLFLPTAVVVAVILGLHRFSSVFHHNWLAVGSALASAYALFGATFLSIGLEADDRLIASAMWSRLRGAFSRAEGNA